VQLSFVLILLSGSACTLQYQAGVPDDKLPVQLQTEAELHFLEGDFDKALREFQRLHETAITAEERNQALFGLACTQIMAARTDEQFSEAIANLQKWDAEKGTSPFVENRRLLIFALKHHDDLLETRNRERIQLEITKNRLIADQRREISQLTEALKKLQKQLEELEAIDENFQEKRKTL
jgi:outer membrane protein assembly factor BamD (BamD/ComL family)